MENICNIKENVDIIRYEINETCAKIGRNPEEVLLMGVSKTKTAQDVEAAIKASKSINLPLKICEVTEDMIREERAQVLDATQEDIRALAEAVEAVLAAEQICVIGNEEKVEAQKDLFKEVKELF